MQFETHTEITILIAEDDDGHAELISDSLREAGLDCPIIRFRNGKEALDFFFGAPYPVAETGPFVESGRAYVLLLDIRMPKVDGIEVLRQVKQDPRLKSMPVIMLTTTDDPREIRACHGLGCSFYVTKPVDFQQFSEILSRLGLFLQAAQVPVLDGGQDAIRR